MTASELLDWLGDHHVLPAPQVEELRAQLFSFSDAPTLAQELVQRQWLNPHQVNQILRGKDDQLLVGANSEEVTATLNQTDLAAVLTAPPLAQAIPVTEAVPAGIPIVQAVAVGQAFPMAKPVEALPSAHDDPFGMVGHDAHAAGDHLGIAMPVAQAMAGIPAAAAPKQSKARLFLFGGSAIAVLAITGAVIAMLMRDPRPGSSARAVYGPGAALTILPLEPVTFKEGNSKFVIVKIQRKDFTGPVELTVKDPPDGIRAQTITFSDNQDIGQFRLTVSFTTRAMKTDLRVVARAENLQAETKLPLTVVTNRNDVVPD